MFILKNITDFIDFDMERAAVNAVVEKKHSSEINEDAQAEQRKNPELNNQRPSLIKLICLHLHELKLETWVYCMKE